MPIPMPDFPEQYANRIVFTTKVMGLPANFPVILT